MTLLLLLLLGFGLSLITSLATINPKSKFISRFPDICEDGSCKKVFLAKNARLFFNIPNSVFGCIYYIFVGLCVFFGFGKYGFYFTIIPFGMSLYLTYRLFFVHEVLCKICISSHIINASLFSYFLYEVLH